jgi:cysteinyl-tRNA synthetase
LRRALGPEPLDRDGPLIDSAVEEFVAAMDADFNTPDALAVIFDLARKTNTLRAQGDPNGRASEEEHAELDRHRRTLVYLLDVLGLNLDSTERTNGQSIEPYVSLLLDTRRKLRDVKQWALADEIRDRLSDLGITVEDKPGGESTWRVEC